jgi:hypothetical protein
MFGFLPTEPKAPEAKGVLRPEVPTNRVNYWGKVIILPQAGSAAGALSRRAGANHTVDTTAR